MMQQIVTSKVKYLVPVNSTVGRVLVLPENVVPWASFLAPDTVLPSTVKSDSWASWVWFKNQKQKQRCL